MSEYTKEQEAEALKAAQDGLDGRKLPVAQEAIRIVLAMAKRTAEAEEAFARLIADRDYVRSVVTFQRDALKARVAELEAQVPCAWVALDAATRDVLATGRSLESVKAQAAKTGRSYILDKHHPPAITRLPSPPVVVTREMVEALAEFVNLHALWGMGPNGDDLTKPVNAAARAVVAMNSVLEVKP